MPTDADPSDSALSVQWPLAQPWPLHPPQRLVVLASGQGSNFEALVAACRSLSLGGQPHGGQRLAAQVVLLVVNNPGCGAEARAARLGIPCQLINHRDHPSRASLDDALIAACQQAQADLVVMAGWMRIVTPLLVQAYPDRLLNIHPSLLPSFRGLDAVGQALAAGVQLTGCTAHLVRPEVDAGPVLVQAAVPVLPGDDHSSLSARIQRQEHAILPVAVALAAARLAG